VVTCYEVSDVSAYAKATNASVQNTEFNADSIKVAAMIRR
jgi:hypothetical protein